MRCRFPALVAALTVASALTAQDSNGPAAGQSPDTMVAAQDVTRVNQLLGTIMSPFCPGLTLATCPSPNAESLRVAIRERLASGESPEAITESLVAAFGEEVRGAPKPRGLGLVLWGLPLAALAAAALALSWWLRRRAGPEPIRPDVAAAPAPTPDDLARLAAERKLVD